MVSDLAIAALLRNAWLNMYFGAAQSKIPGLRYGAATASEISKVILKSVEIDRFDESGITERKVRESRGHSARILKAARINPASVFTSSEKQATWRPHKGERAVLSQTGKKDAHGRPIPSHIIRYEPRSIGGKRRLVGIERRIKAVRQKNGTYKPVFQSGGRWISRPSSKAKPQRRKK